MNGSATTPGGCGSPGVTAGFNTTIAPWYELSGGGRPALLNDGIYYRLCTSDGQVLHEVDHFLHLSIGTYRRDLWHGAPVHVEIWIEKDALAGTIMEETDPYDVPLMVARGFSSETYLYETAQAITNINKPSFIYAFFDHDPSGEHSAKHIERKLREFAPGAETHFELVAVTEQQIVDWKLPTRETKRGKNAHAKNFVGDSCELDAIPPDRLRDLVSLCIDRHIDRGRLATLQAPEGSEREALKMFAQSWEARP
jgi:hypothetical protein